MNSVPNETAYMWLECVSKDHAIAGDNKHVWFVNTTTGKRKQLELPAGIVRPTITAMGSKLRHLALASGSDVWILDVR